MAEGMAAAGLPPDTPSQSHRGWQSLGAALCGLWEPGQPRPPAPLTCLKAPRFRSWLVGKVRWNKRWPKPEAKAETG